MQRVLSWARYLPDSGIDVHVLAPDDPGWIDTGGGLQIPQGITVHRTPSRSPRSFVPAAQLGRRGRASRILMKIKMIPRRLLVPDIHVAWAIGSRKTALEICRAHTIDAIISTSPPESAHLLASKVRKTTGSPWLADFRDSWLDLPHLRLDQFSVRIKHWFNTRLASRILRHADLITTVSQPLADDLKKRYPTKSVNVLTNGIDFDQLPEVENVEHQISRENRDRFELLYTGNFFGRQNAKTMLDAIEVISNRYPEMKGAFTIKFVGGLKPADAKRISESPVLGQFVRHIEFADYNDILKMQALANMLFLYVAPGRGSKGVYTGKVFEYVACGTPILALAPSDNVAAKLVLDSGTGIVIDPDDAEACALAIHEAWQKWTQGQVERTRLSDLHRAAISREELAKQLAAHLRQLTPAQ